MENQVARKTTLKPDCIFETSWEVCNKVGGIYTVLSSRAKTMQKFLRDHIFFIGPDLGQGKDPTSDFREDATLLPSWRAALSAEGIRCRIGRWKVPGEPIAILVDYTPYYEKKNEIYAQAWTYFGVDSLHAYGDYDESSMFSYAAGKLAACICRQCLSPQNHVIYQAHEWMSGLGMLFLKKEVPFVATVFTTHATSIGRSIAGNNKLLYEYFPGYNGDQMARELNMESKHSVEKQSAHHADCFSTVSEVTARECTQLLEKTPDVILPNGFEPDFVPRPGAYAKRRRIIRQAILRVHNCLTGTQWPDDTLILSTSGRNDFRCKGFDVFIDALVDLRKQSLKRPVLALIEVPCWVREARADLASRLCSNQSYTTPLETPMLTHWLNNMDDDRILNLLRQKELNNLYDDRLHVLFIPCYLDGADGIFNHTYYDMLLGSDVCAYPSYYEPWGYTPLESTAFGIPCVTTDLAGFGQWVNSELGHEGELTDGVKVIHRTDLNYFEVVNEVSHAVRQAAVMQPTAMADTRRNAAGLAGKAQWKQFIRYYHEAYDFALRKAGYAE